MWKLVSFSAYFLIFWEMESSPFFDICIGGRVLWEEKWTLFLWNQMGRWKDATHSLLYASWHEKCQWMLPTNKSHILEYCHHRSLTSPCFPYVQASMSSQLRACLTWSKINHVDPFHKGRAPSWLLRDLRHKLKCLNKVHLWKTLILWKRAGGILVFFRAQKSVCLLKMKYKRRWKSMPRDDSPGEGLKPYLMPPTTRKNKGLPPKPWQFLPLKA